jgi:hypothetical protein
MSGEPVQRSDLVTPVKSGTAALSSTDKGKGKTRAIGDADARSKPGTVEKKITAVEDVSSPGELTIFVRAGTPGDRLDHC